MKALQLEIQFNFSFNQMLLAHRRGDVSAESRLLCICLKFYQKMCCFCSPSQVAHADKKLNGVFL